MQDQELFVTSWMSNKIKLDVEHYQNAMKIRNQTSIHSFSTVCTYDTFLHCKTRQRKVCGNCRRILLSPVASAKLYIFVESAASVRFRHIGLLNSCNLHLCWTLKFEFNIIINSI